MRFETACRSRAIRANHRMSSGIRGFSIRSRIFGIVGLSLGIWIGGGSAHSANHGENACKLMQERSGWYNSVSTASEKWQIPIPSLLAVIHHESRFQATADAPQSTAYGFAQALDGTWDRYRRVMKADQADRTSFADSVDFIGWYMTETRKRAGVAADDTASHYLAYHEGIAGFRSTRWREKPRLIRIAENVAVTAGNYGEQLNDCALPERGAKAPEVSALPIRKPFALSDVPARLPTSKPSDRYVAELSAPLWRRVNVRRLH